MTGEKKTGLDLSKLTEPFKASDIEWRVQSSGIKTGKPPWAMVLAYVTARAVQNRLDEVFGPLGWKDSYRHEAGGVICTLAVYDTKVDQWVEKENGSPETEIEAFKGGISKAFVRVASSGLGVGRYLYDLDTAFVNHVDNGKRYDIIKDKKTKQKIGTIKWNEPSLPAWALPPGKSTPERNEPPATAKTQTHPEPPSVEESAKLWNDMQLEISDCTTAPSMAKWFADNAERIATGLTEDDKVRLRALYKEYSEIFKKEQNDDK